MVLASVKNPSFPPIPECIGDVYFLLGPAENELFAKNGQWPSEWGQGVKVKLQKNFSQKGQVKRFSRRLICVLDM